MYIYVDEFGSLNSPPAGVLDINSRLFALGALVVPTNRSRRRLSVAITRARSEQVKSLQHCKCLTCKKEVKGSHLLPKVRKRLFRKLARCEDVQFYAIVIDKEKLRQRLAKLHGKRYNRAVVNLLARFRIPKMATWITLIVDRGGVGLRTKTQHHSLTALFEEKIRSRGAHVAVRIRDSHLDRCLQMVDVLVNFALQRFVIQESIAKAQKQAEGRHAKKLLQERRQRLKGWNDARKPIRKRMHLWAIPPHALLSKSLRRLVKARIESTKKKGGSNRRG